MLSLLSMHDTDPLSLTEESASRIGDITASLIGSSIDDSASPSLGSTQSNDRPAYEIKFAIDGRLAADVEKHFSSWLTLDPHGEGALDQSYRIASLYTDSEAFDVFHRREGYRKTKCRVRRYGSEALAYLEQKARNGNRVRKTRVAVADHDLEKLNDPESKGWPGSPYHSALVRQSLRPVCQITYLRRAYFACSEGTRLRLTFDRDLRGMQANGWVFRDDRGAVPFAQGRVICEFKFQQAMPVAFKRAIEEFQLVPGGFSKYRHCVSALGLVQSGDAACA